jgi:predicted TIM-barrel enzyme
VTRAEALARLRAQIAAGSPVIGAGAGTGLSAKLAEAGGADLIIIYNSGRFRMGGRGSLSGLMPYGDANEIVVDMAREVLPVVKDTPVLAGVCGTDPFRLMPVFIAELKRMGFSGVQNFPTVGLIDGTFRINLEETGMGYGLEVDAIRIRLQRRRRNGNGRGGRGRARAPHGAHDRRLDRRRHGEDARRLRAADSGDARRREAGEP